ncbi:MAG: phosphoribosylglycinamide formyltransferase [Phycisphaerae bacterium]|jgi:formyltetrahydrofolate-dependent phosphoribosylglycinamide formyltransferase|nr:phosphoribosylglycinamide formyltransferase [Phycisphaerae bacterium]MDP7637691.1 phosphoribosylglycinamide formyltransferase [Phycisphaerae bacterium]
MKKLRLSVLLSGGGRTLMNILEEIRAGRLEAEVAVVIGSRPCKGIDRSRDAGLNVHVVPHKQMPDVETYSVRIVSLLDQAKVDLVIQAGFLSLWRIPRQYQDKVMNIHPALLPSFGGTGMYGHHVHEAVVARGCKVSGCTVHFVTNEYDAGPIIVQKCVPVKDTDTPEEIAARVFEQECIAYPEAIRLFAEGKLTIDDGVVRVRP